MRDGRMTQQELRKYYTAWPVVRCSNVRCKDARGARTQFGAFPSMVSLPCIFCAPRDGKGKIAGPPQGVWVRVDVEELEPEFAKRAAA